MNYYEELGVTRWASIADIRLAYKTLVRVLHPDQQQDENQKRLSELQLRRLNNILQVLSDPEQRRQYDASLDRVLLPMPRPPERLPPRKLSLSEIRTVRLHLRLNTGVFVWLLIAAIAVGSFVVWIRSPEPAPRGLASAASVPTAKPTEETVHRVQEPVERPNPETKPAEVRATPVAHQAIPEAVKPSPLGVTASQKPVVAQTLPPPVADPPKKVLAAPTSDPVVVATTIPPPVKSIVQEAPPAPVKASNPSIAGKWLYVPRAEDSKTLYPAEYIELRISSRAGLLRGRYRGKYRVNDRAISSEINFQFEGKQGESVSLLPWSSSNGSKGELQVRRLSDESIEVSWITTSFGNSNTLASGTAVLYRSDPP